MISYPPVAYYVTERREGTTTINRDRVTRNGEVVDMSGLEKIATKDEGFKIYETTYYDALRVILKKELALIKNIPEGKIDLIVMGYAENRINQQVIDEQIEFTLFADYFRRRVE